MKKFAFIVSGSGVFAGTENNELTLALLAISRMGGEYKIFAPGIMCDLVDPFDGKSLNAKSNILYESAIITRGEVMDLEKLEVENFDVLVIPGGFGVVKNLSNINKFLNNHDNYQDGIKVNELVKKKIEEFHTSHKFIVAICISPLLIASVIKHCTFTLGDLSNEPKNFPIDLDCVECDKNQGFYLDAKNKIYSIPAFMSSTNLSVIFHGIENGFKDLFNKISPRMKIGKTNNVMSL